MRMAHPLLKKRKTMDDKEKQRQTAEGGADATAPGQGSGALIESPEEAVAPPERGGADLKDKHLPLAAPDDNFCQPAAQERGEVWGEAEAGLALRPVGALRDPA